MDCRVKGGTWGWILFLALVFFMALTGSVYAASYDQIVRFLEDLQTQFPVNARTFNLGESDSDRQIRGLSIGNGPVKSLVVATHHGNEYGSTAVAKAFAAALAANPIPDHTVYIIPVLNISGYEGGIRWETVGKRRFDPNRDYPGPCGGEGPHKLKSTASLARFVDQAGIVVAATLHTFYPAVVYPWGVATSDVWTPYEGLFRTLAGLATRESGYPIGNATETIYPANGTFEDYAFWRHGIWSLLFELGSTHSPGKEHLERMERENVPGIRRFLEQAPHERAEKHEFTGRCDSRLLQFDLHDE